LLLVTGSRGGLAVGVVGIAVAAALLWMARDRSGASRTLSRLTAAAAAVGLTGLVAAGLYFSRAQAITRLFDDPVADLRFKFWRPVWALVTSYFPIGSGWGSFVEVYQIVEPRDLLATTYLNHAHNDWLEVVLTGGVLGLLLLIIALALWAWAVGQLFGAGGRREDHLVLARVGATWIGIAGLMSLSDYPLRVPFLAAYFVVAAVWLSDGLRHRRPEPLPSHHHRRASDLRPTRAR
jgi:O-antigen ligase